MKTNILTNAADLSDQDLLARLEVLAGHEREATAELVAHLAELDTRPVVYAAEGHGSLFRYCVEALRLSEDAACNRIEAARASRRFPHILGLLASGALSLAAVRLLGRHLTAENQQAVLARAANRSRREIEALVAELAPRADVPSVVRKLPSAAVPASPVQAMLSAPEVVPALEPSPPPAPRRVVQMTAPARYRVQFTIGEETQDKLRRLQSLLRREIPDGDPGVIFDRAINLLLEKVERSKLGHAVRPRPSQAIRPGTDDDAPDGALPPRDPSNAVKRAVWARDGGRCAYVSPHGRRCTERTFLEFHHRRPFALGGEATVENIALRCRLHNQYEAELVFGPTDPPRFAYRSSTRIRRQPIRSPRAGGVAALDDLEGAVGRVVVADEAETIRPDRNRRV